MWGGLSDEFVYGGVGEERFLLCQKVQEKKRSKMFKNRNSVHVMDSGVWIKSEIWELQGMDGKESF